MNRPLTLAYSPCPNDTFIFCALARKLIDLKGLDFEVHLHDVEHLNQSCTKALYDISKISIAAYPHFQDSYMLLHCGSALGRGCGPLLVARPDTDIKHLARGEVAVPGLMTTAYLLLCFFAGRPLRVTPVPFETIMPAVSRGEFDYGVIIHEGRFTYRNYGLNQLIDLGQWWEEKTSLPLPLGGIVIKRVLGKRLATAIDSLIQESLKFAWKDPEATRSYVKEHAQEMQEAVIEQHIQLYVNQYTASLGKEGERAVVKLLEQGAELGILPPTNHHLMAY